MSTLKVNAIEKKDADQTLTIKDATLTGATPFPAGLPTGRTPGTDRPEPGTAGHSHSVDRVGIAPGGPGWPPCRSPRDAARSSARDRQTA